MHTIMITMRYGLSARSVLRTDLYKNLKKNGCKIIIVCPAANEPYLKKELGDNTTLELYPVFKLGFWEKIFSATANIMLFSHPLCTRTLAIKRLIDLRNHAYLSFLMAGLVSFLRLDRSYYLRLWAEKLDWQLFSHPSFEQLIKKYAPDLLVTTDLFGPDLHFVREARKKNIETICLVKSWDNLTSKTRIRVCPDWIVVWSEQQKQEAMQLHFVPEHKIKVLGALNFDHLANPKFIVASKEAFFKKIGVKPDRKLILYAAANKMTFSDENNIRLLNKIFESDALKHMCHLHIRKYPKAQKDFDFVDMLPNCSAEDSGKVVPAWVDRVDQTKKDLYHAKELLTHTDILIQVGSTIALDAAYLNKPVFCLSIEEEIKKTSYFETARYSRHFTHNFYLEKSGGICIITNVDELVASLNKYLDNPQFDSEKRQKMVKLIAGDCDGKAGQRISDFILFRLNSSLQRD